MPSSNADMLWLVAEITASDHMRDALVGGLRTEVTEPADAVRGESAGGGTRITIDARELDERLRQFVQSSVEADAQNEEEEHNSENRDQVAQIPDPLHVSFGLAAADGSRGFRRSTADHSPGGEAFRRGSAGKEGV